MKYSILLVINHITYAINNFLVVVITDCASSVDCSVLGVPKDCQVIYDYGVQGYGSYVCAVCIEDISVKVRCDMEPGDIAGWTVIQRRTDGELFFHRIRDEYRAGFGNPNDELWIGLDKIHNLTYTKPNMLQVLLNYF